MARSMQMILKMFLVLGFLAVVSHAHAEEAPVKEAADRFGEELEGLKASAAKLSLRNAAMSAANSELRTRMSAQQIRLGKLVEESNDLTKAALKLQDSNPTRTKKITQLEKDNFDIDSRTDHLTEQGKTDKDAMEREKAQEGPLDAKLAQLGLMVQKPEPQIPSPADAHQKEKLRLLKMIYESKQRQADLYVRLSDSQKNVPVSSGSSFPGKKHTLAAKIREAEDSIEEMNKRMALAVSVSQNDPNEGQIRKMEEYVRELQKNHDELEDLIAQMQQKSQKIAMTPEQRSQANKLRTSLGDLSGEGRKLKADLNDLRQDMVALDKKKTRLELMMRN